jgi:putative tricarboxylic transport membrane protein
MSYNEARRWSRRPEEFGKGSAEAIAAPETANNTVACTALVPTLTFGIPGSNSTAVLLGGFLIHGLQPGPLLFAREPEFIYGLYGGLAVANLSLAVLGILVLTPCLWLVSRPKPWLLAGIYALIFSGVYSVGHSLLELWIVLAAGVLGYGLRYFGFPVLPLVLGVILGHMIESNYRRSLVIARGDHMIFLQDPVSAGLLIVAVLFVLGSLARNWYGSRQTEATRSKA